VLPVLGRTRFVFFGFADACDWFFTNLGGIPLDLHHKVQSIESLEFPNQGI
jgi:hypothetical protein